MYRLVFLAVTAVLLTSGPAFASSNAPSPLLTKHLVEIGGGRRMNIVCTGHGSPTVVFEYGLGGHQLNWQKVQPAISALTTACFYDRAGYGFSDPPSGPVTARTTTDDLYWLLTKSGVKTPVVLVGHSLGGLYATLYADRFPSQVAGLVLIDPLFAGEDLDETAEEQARAQAAYDRSQTWMENCLRLAYALSIRSSGACFPSLVGRSPAEIEYLTAQVSNPHRWETMLSESRNVHAPDALSEDEREEQTVARTFGDMPLVVLTAGIIPAEGGETPEEHEKSIAHWKAGHDRLAARSARGESTVVPNATHMIQLDQPQAVIDAVRKVVTDVGAKGGNRR